MNRIKISKLSKLTILLGIFLCLSIAIGTAISIQVLHDKAIDDWKQRASSIALILAENTAQQMTAAYLALDGITERVNAASIVDAQGLRDKFSDEAMFRMMSDKAASSPQIDVATIVAVNGDVINFTRKWPAPKINLSERDYFKAHKENPNLGVLVSDPVRNKGNGKWTFYISRRLNDPQGNFIGMVIVGISTDYYSDFYQRITQNSKATINLYRDDLTFMARWPIKDEVMGKRNLIGSTNTIINEQKRKEGVIVSDTPRMAKEGEIVARIAAVKSVQKYPLIISYIIDEDVYLHAWKENTRLILIVAVGSIVAIFISFTLLVRALRRGEQTLLETLRLKQEAEMSAHEKTLLLETLSQNQQALRDTSEHMSAIVDHAPDAILIIDEQGKILSNNFAAEQIFDLSAEHISGSEIESLIPDAINHEQTENNENNEYTGLRAKNTPFPCDVSKGQFYISGQQRQVFIVRDISERKRTEKAKTEFISTVSHELRTPLTAIRGSLGLLRGGVAGVLPKVGNDLLNRAYNCTEVLTRLINDLLDLQKMEIGKMDFNLGYFPLASMLESAVATNQAYAEPLKVKIILEGEIPEIKLHVDEGRFQQIMANLLSNACKFSKPESLVSIRASYLQETLKDSGEQVRIEVIDHGQGIPEEYRTRMFQKFTQADSSDTRIKGGTGLGLSITKEIILQMHGRIDYTSGMGVGTTFFIDFPIAREDMNNGEQSAA